MPKSCKGKFKEHPLHDYAIVEATWLAGVPPVHYHLRLKCKSCGTRWFKRWADETPEIRQYMGEQHVMDKLKGKKQ